MALYREDATGFVQEHATNPGAGYTAISAMPTTSIPDRAEWWRDLDKWNQTSDWHPSLDDTVEDPNDNYLAIAFTNESALVSADPDGTVTDGFLGATTEVRIMRGSRNVTLTEGWSFGLDKNPNEAAFTYTWTGTDVKTLQITGFPTDETSGYIRITATRTGSTTLQKDFKILKVIKGEDGTNGTNGVRGSRQIVVSGTSWSDSAAWNGIVAQTGTDPVLSDLVTIADAGTGFSVGKFYSGGANPGSWTTATAYINGNLLVTGTVGANKLVTNSITTSYLAFTPVQSGGSAADINANATTISGSKITTGTLSADVISGGTINGSTVNVTNLNATNITGGSLSVDRLSVGSITAPKFANNSTTRVSSTGGSDTYSTMSGGATYTVSQYTTASPPSGGRSAGGTNRVFVNITGTVYTNNATDRGFTFYVMRNSGSGWTALSTAVAIYVRAANCSSNYGISFALQATDYYVGDTDTVSYTLGIMNAAGFSGLANPYTFTYGVTAIDQYK